MEGLFERPYIPDAQATLRRCGGAIEAGITEPAARRDELQRAVGLVLGPEQNGGVATHDGEDGLDARPVPGRRGGRVETRVDDHAAAEVATQPAGENDTPGGIDELLDLAGHATSGLERVHRKVQLLHTAADEVDQRPAERPEQRRPLRPDVQVVSAGVLVEITHSGVKAARVEAIAVEKRAVRQEAEV